MTDLDLAPDTLAGGVRTGRLLSTYRRLRSPSRLRSVVDYLAFAALAVATMVASRPGLVSDDTKTYLYLDPGRYVRQAASLWDPNVALGTVTHENIGYLLPMGPFYWVLAELHVPLWVAQRLWMSALLFAAGAGALYLCRAIGLVGPGRYVTALAFMFTPYVLQYAGRISVILLPWTGLPWMVAFTILAVRKGGWRYPALFALVVALVSGINASSIIYVGTAPLLWLLYAVIVAKEATWRQAWAVAWRIVLLTGLASLWWAIGLQVEAAYGVNVLKYTETVPTTSSTSLASEVLRGLGYWYFYGSDRVGAWTQSAVAYAQQGWLVALSFAVPALAFLSAALVRWKHRVYFVLLVVVGALLSVGPYPYDHPSGVGSLLKAFMVDTTAGLALRSTDRATPLVILGLAVLLGAAVTAVARRVRTAGLLFGAGAAALVAGATTPLWTGAIIANGFTQPATPPTYVQQAATALDRTHPGTRVYALPGNDFGASRWGDTIDTVYPGLLTRPFVTHEQQIMGSMPTADLLYALDAPLQNGVEDWDALAPVAALMSAGDVLAQYDQAYERYDTPQPKVVGNALTTTPAGLSNPRSYGTPRPNVSTISHYDEALAALAPDQPWTPPLVSYTVDHPRPVVRAESTAHPLVVDGDASGIVNAASMGLLGGNPTILYAGTLDTDKHLQKQTLAKPADLVVTDTNRKQGFRWNSLNESTGYTETAAQGPDKADPSDAPIDLFPKAPSDARTTTVFTDLQSVTASSYGSSVTYLPENRPAAAVDGNTQTAWLDNSFANPDGQWWQATLTRPTTTDHVTLVQPQTGDPDRWMTRITLTFDGTHRLTVELGKQSRQPTGQTITFPSRTFTTLRITVDTFGAADAAAYTGFGSSVGLAEVMIPGVQANETVSMPQDLLRAAGASSLGDRLTLLMTRLRAAGYPPRSDVEASLQRTFWLPTTRTFSLTGEARISPLVPDDEIDRLVGRPGADHTGLVAYSEGRLPGDLKAGAINTVDGDSSTLWEPGFGAAHQAGEWLEYDLPNPRTFDRLDLQIVADGEHSVPTSVTVTAGGVSESVKLPPIANGRVTGSVTTVPVTFPTLTGSSIRLTFDTVDDQTSVNYYSQQPLAMPIGVAEVGIPGLHASPVPATVPAHCTDHLLTIDGKPISVLVDGTSSAALDGDALAVTLCGADANGITLGPGNHVLRTVGGNQVVDGTMTGWDLDQLALDSAPGGGAEPEAAGQSMQLTPPPTTTAPKVTVDSQSATAMRLTVSGVTPSTSPFDLVLGESVNAGWGGTVRAGATGAPTALGKPTLIDGFANGWRIDPAALHHATAERGTSTGTLTVDLAWKPQERVDIALVVSALTILLCLFLAYFPRRWRRLPRRPRWLPRTGAWAWLRWPSWVRRVLAGPPPQPVATCEPPALSVPFGAEGRRSGVVASLAIGVATGLVAAAIARPVTGLAVGAATILALLVPRARVLLGLAAVGLVVAAGAYVTVHHSYVEPFASGSWPTQFPLASTLAWAGIVFLGADAVVEITRRWRNGRPEDTPTP